LLFLAMGLTIRTITVRQKNSDNQALRVVY